MSEVQIGIIGAGNIAAEHLKAIERVSGIKVVGIASRTLVKAQELAGRHNIKLVADSIGELVKQGRPQALMVLVSPDQMKAVAGQVLPFKLPLFIEKPAGLSDADNLELLEASRRHGVEVMVGFNRRYYSIFHKGLELVRSRGPLLGVSVTGHERIWLQEARSDAAFQKDILPHWIFANSVHTIDLLRFFGGEVSDLKIAASSYKQPQGDQFAAVMQLSSGAIGQYSAHWQSPGGWSATLYGDGITVEFKPLEQGRWIDRDFKAHDITADEHDQTLKPGFFGQIQAFRDLVSTGKKAWPLQDLEGSYKTMAMARQMVDAAAVPART